MTQISCPMTYLSVPKWFTEFMYSLHLFLNGNPRLKRASMISFQILSILFLTYSLRGKTLGRTHQSMALSQVTWENTGNDIMEVRLAFQASSAVKEARQWDPEEQRLRWTKLPTGQTQEVGIWCGWRRRRVWHCLWEPLVGTDIYTNWG